MHLPLISNQPNLRAWVVGPSLVDITIASSPTSQSTARPNLNERVAVPSLLASPSSPHLPFSILPFSFVASPTKFQSISCLPGRAGGPPSSPFFSFVAINILRPESAGGPFLVSSPVLSIQSSPCLYLDDQVAPFLPISLQFLSLPCLYFNERAIHPSLLASSRPIFRCPSLGERVVHPPLLSSPLTSVLSVIRATSRST
jgi:hypothetical protein